MHLFLKSLPAAFLLLSLFSCKKDQSTEPQSGIEYKQIDSIFSAKSLNPLALDINNDGIADLEFFAEQIHLEDQLKEAFLVRCLNDNKILLVNNTYNSLFNCRDLATPTLGEIISDENSPSKTWDSKAGFIASRIVFKGEEFYGPWSDEKEKSIAVKLMKEGKPYFGWIRIKFVRSTIQITLLDYAVNKSSGEGIKAGADVLL